MLVCPMCCQARLRQGNQSCSAAGPLRRRHLPAGGSRALTEGCRPDTASITREKGQSNHKDFFAVVVLFRIFFFLQKVIVEIRERWGRAPLLEWNLGFSHCILYVCVLTTRTPCPIKFQTSLSPTLRASENKAVFESAVSCCRHTSGKLPEPSSHACAQRTNLCCCASEPADFKCLTCVTLALPGPRAKYRSR